MAISRIKTWVHEILTFQALNAEFDNILDNALTLISPLTGNLAAGGNDITGIDELAFDNAGAGASAAGRLRRNLTKLSWHDTTAARDVLHNNYTGGATLSHTTGTVLSLVTSGVDSQAILTLANDARTWQVYVDGSSTDAFTLRDSTGAANRLVISTAGVFTFTGTVALVPAVVAGTPAVNQLYAESIARGWINCNYAGTIADSYNVTSITDGGTGDTTVTWDRDFATANYACIATVKYVTAEYASIQTILAGSVRIASFTPGGAGAVLADGAQLHVVAFGDQ